MDAVSKDSGFAALDHDDNEDVVVKTAINGEAPPAAKTAAADVPPAAAAKPLNGAAGVSAPSTKPEQNGKPVDGLADKQGVSEPGKPGEVTGPVASRWRSRSRERGARGPGTSRQAGDEAGRKGQTPGKETRARKAQRREGS
ncbi:uncharacterized protein LOC119597280 [Penaeus monodon]|uniref:uncharacterized protein LOC119597280 n=1 Tax=Penaeus monodon TaxID=6687 RepID=UPI0018A7B6FE|nr:uncharacterized protein LOC119597280 [Penaeus monodon]XP_037802743.1 uncharacterized protein LOC119597280 [Penaeus monodon]